MINLDKAIELTNRSKYDLSEIDSALEQYYRSAAAERDTLRQQNNRLLSDLRKAEDARDLKHRLIVEHVLKRKEAEAELELKQGSLDSMFAKTERLWQWARENLTGDIADQFWQIAANGSLMTENPEHQQRVNILRHENDALCGDLAKAVDKNAEWEKRCYAAEAERDSYRQEWAAAMDWINAPRKENESLHIRLAAVSEHINKATDSITLEAWQLIKERDAFRQQVDHLKTDLLKAEDARDLYKRLQYEDVIRRRAAEAEVYGLRTELATCNQALAVAQARIKVLEGVAEAANEFIFSLDTEPAHACKCGGKCKGDGNA